MESKNISSEKMTDQSSNQSTISEQFKFNQNQAKNLSANIPKEEKNQNKTPLIRKYTLEPQIFQKEFVPVLKPIEIHLVPSKLRLNDIKFKHNKNKNKYDKDNTSCISCPCSEEESEINYYLDMSNSSEISDSSDLSNNKNIVNNLNENGLKDIRKKFIKIRTGSIHKVMTKKNLKNKKLSQQYDCFDIVDKENCKECKDEEDNFSSESFDDNNIFISDSIKPNEDHNQKLILKQTKSSNFVTNSIKNYDSIMDKSNDIDDEDEKDDNIDNKINKKRYRIYSSTILETLKNKLKIDK